MSSKTIPSRVEVTCDCCLQVIDEEKVTRDRTGKLNLHRSSDQGTDASQHMDLCDGCLVVVEQHLSYAVRVVRASMKEQT